VGNWFAACLGSHRRADGAGGTGGVDGAAAVAGAIEHLRTNARVLRARAAERYRDIDQLNAELVRLGLRVQRRGKLLSRADAHIMLGLSHRRRHLLESHRQLQQLLTNVAAQTTKLEDAVLLEHSASTLAGALHVHGVRADASHAILEDVRVQLARVLDVCSSSSAQLRALERASDVPLDDGTVEELSTELGALMASDEFASVVERVRAHLVDSTVPSVPDTDPDGGAAVSTTTTTTVDAEAVMGLA
jgi:hypothetical protein